MEPGSAPSPERDVQQLAQRTEAERSRVDALIGRVDALEIEVPLGQVELHEELDALEAKLEAAAAEAPPTRHRGVIGTLRVDRPIPEGDPTAE